MAGIRRKRADLRREKSQLHDLDNEEGFDMDDEAELTGEWERSQDSICRLWNVRWAFSHEPPKSDKDARCNAFRLKKFKSLTCDVNNSFHRSDGHRRR